MRVSTAPHLPLINHESGIINSKAFRTLPFENLIKSLELNAVNERAQLRKTRKISQEIYIPAGVKSYDESNLQELTVRSRFKSNDYRQRYMNIYQKNPYAFHKQTGEFTYYSDCSVRINRAGPYNKSRK